MLASLDTASYIIIGGFSLFLGSLFFVQRFANNKVIADEKRITNLRQALYELRQNPQLIQQIDSRMKEDSTTYQLWQEFYKSFVTTPDSATQEMTKFRVYRAEYLFNNATLLNEIGSKRYSATSSTLLGVGLLGTFIGLGYGLLNLDMSNAEQLKESMNTLISAAGAKFATSILGLFLSLWFGRYERNLEHEMSLEIKRIQEILDYLIPEKNAEQSLLNLEQLTSQTNNYLKKIHENNNTTNQLLDDLKQFLTQQANAQATFYSNSENFYKGIFAVQTATYQELQTSRQTNQEQLTGLVSLSSSQNAYLQNILAENQQQNTALTDVLTVLPTIGSIKKQDEQIEVLNGLALDINEKLKETLASSIIEPMSTAVQRLEKNIGGDENATLHNAVSQLAKPLGEIVTTLPNISNIEKQDEQIEILNGLSLDINEKLKETLASSIVEPMSTAVQRLEKNIGGHEEAGQTLYDAVNRMSSGIGDGFADKLQEILQNTITGIQGQAGNEAKAFTDNAQSLSQLIDQMKESMIDFNSNLTHHIGLISQENQNATKDIANATTAVFNDLNHKIENIAQKNSETTSMITNVTTQMVNQLQTHFQQLNNENQNTTFVLQNATTSMVASLENKINQICENTNTTAEMLTNQTKQMTQDITNALEPVTTSFEKLTRLIDNSEQHLKVVPQHLETFKATTENLVHSANSTLSASKLLNQSSMQLNSGLSGANTNLITSAIKMSDTIKPLTESLNKLPTELNQTVIQLQNLSEKMEGMSQAFEPITTSFAGLDTLISNSKEQLKNVPEYLSSFNLSASKLAETANSTFLASEKLKNSSSQLSSGFIMASTNLTTSAQEMSNAIKPLTESLGNLPTTLNQTVQNMTSISQEMANISTTSAQTYENLATQYQELIEKNKQSAEDFSAVLTTVQDKMTNIIVDFGEISTRIFENYEDLIHKLMEEFEQSRLAYQQKSDENLEKSLEAFAQRIEEYQKSMSEHLEKMLEKFSDSIKTYQDSTDELIAKVLAQFDKSLQEFAKGLSDAINELNESLEDLSHRISK